MMPSKSRPHIVQTTLNAVELATLRESAEREGLTPTAYLRRLLISDGRLSRLDSRTALDSRTVPSE